jgi:sugar O-acyltransferase (sialic acid O-acetyltransferase NeuD family)
MYSNPHSQKLPLIPLVIIGSGGFGREVRWLVDEINATSPTYSLLGFLNTDKQSDSHTPKIDDLPVFDARFFSEAPNQLRQTGLAVAIGIGLPAIRRRVALSLPPWTTLPNLIHPSVKMSSRVRLGEPEKRDSGIIITAGNILTTNITIAEHAMINLSCTVGHDVSIGAYAVVSPGANISGCVAIGTGSSVGTGAKVIEGKRIGEWAVVGAGAVVISDVPDNSTVVGAPAKVVKTRPAGWQDIPVAERPAQNPAQ